MASLASLLGPSVSIPQPDYSWIGNAADSIVGGIQKRDARKNITEAWDQFNSGKSAPPQAGGFISGLAASSGVHSPNSGNPVPVMPVDRSAAQGDTFEPFIGTIKKTVRNPYGLAAIAATGRAESGWSSENANRSWSDPSQSGDPGTAGGIMSWRGPRLASLQAYASSKGEEGNGSPQTQGEFLLKEDPALIERLNSAGSPQEAADIMAGAWKFAGYDSPEKGEAARRRAMAINYAPTFQGDPSLSAETSPALAAIDQQAPGGNGSPLTDDAFDNRFGQTALPAELAQGRDGLAAALTEGNAAGGVPMPTESAPQAFTAPATQAQPQQVSANATAPAALPTAQQEAPVRVSGDLIGKLLTNPYSRDIGVELWKTTVEGRKAGFDFMMGPNGDLIRTDKAGNAEIVGNYAKPIDPNANLPNSYREFQLAKQGGYTGTYEQWEKQKIPGGVTVNNVPGEGATAKAAGEGLGKMFSGMFDDGLNAKSDLASINVLRSSIAQSPNGAVGALAGIASDFGINLGPNADQVQVAKAVIAKLVPAQRPPGSGTTSDRDLALFQDSLPRLSGTPEGNQIILDTMQALAEHKAAQGAIVADYYAGGDGNDQASTIKKLRELPDPFAGFKRLSSANGGVDAGGAPRRATNPQTGEILELRNGQWVPVDG